MDHSVNDYQDFLHMDNKHLDKNGRMMMDKTRVNATFGLVISQLRALESAPALLFTQFEGLMSHGYVTGEKDDHGNYIGYKHASVSNDFKCFDLRLPENQKRFDLPGTDDCWQAPSWIKKPCNSAEAVAKSRDKVFDPHGVTGRDFCHYIADGKHNIWCHTPDAYHIEDVTSAPLAERGVPLISMRDIVWRVNNVQQMLPKCAPGEMRILRFSAFFVLAFRFLLLHLLREYC